MNNEKIKITQKFKLSLWFCPPILSHSLSLIDSLAILFIISGFLIYFLIIDSFSCPPEHCNHDDYYGINSFVTRHWDAFVNLFCPPLQIKTWSCLIIMILPMSSCLLDDCTIPLLLPPSALPDPPRPPPHLINKRRQNVWHLNWILVQKKKPGSDFLFDRKCVELPKKKAKSKMLLLLLWLEGLWILVDVVVVSRATPEIG